MTRLRISLVAAFGAFLIALPQPARAQNGAGELSAGWRVLNIEEETFLAGWYADVVGNITSTFGVVAEVAGHYNSFDETRSVGGIQVAVSADARVHTFMGGVRFSVLQNPRITPFVQALVGLAHGAVDVEGSTTVGGQTFPFDESESASDAAIDLGGGVNIGLTDSMRLRLAGSYFRVFEEDAGNGVRFAVGVVFPF
jgi:opacity protein-like surface antigen